LRPFLSSSPFKNDELWGFVKEGDWKRFWQVFEDVRKIDKDFKEIF
jgi:hypothetical protein